MGARVGYDGDAESAAVEMGYPAHILCKTRKELVGLLIGVVIEIQAHLPPLAAVVLKGGKEVPLHSVEMEVTELPEPIEIVGQHK